MSKENPSDEWRYNRAVFLLCIYTRDRVATADAGLHALGEVVDQGGGRLIFGGDARLGARLPDQRASVNARDTARSAAPR